MYGLWISPHSTCYHKTTQNGKGKRVRTIKETTGGKVRGAHRERPVGEGSRGHLWWRLLTAQNEKRIKCPLEFAKWSREWPTQGIWVEWRKWAEEGMGSEEMERGFPDKGLFHVGYEDRLRAWAASLKPVCETWWPHLPRYAPRGHLFNLPPS